MYRAGVGRGSSQRTWSRLGRRVCWMPVSQTMRAWSSLPLGPRGCWEHQCCPPRVATSIQFWCVRCRSGERRALVRGCARERSAEWLALGRAFCSPVPGQVAAVSSRWQVAGSSGAVARGAMVAGRDAHDARCLGGSAVPAPAAVAGARRGSVGGRLGQSRSRWRSLQLEQLRMVGVSTKSL